MSAIELEEGQKKFATLLMKWHETISRNMPWKETEDAYPIWLSEIILQQTRVAQGLKYYTSILDRFPTVQALAEASEDEVLSAWKGLGYYSRARNLHATAKTIVESYQGKFPRSYAELKSLPGIGDYTAAAIASFAFGLPHAVVDGNVYRVLSRYYGIDDPIDIPSGREIFHRLAQSCLDADAPGSYNQAIMDFGALQCTPQSPDCPNCTLQQYCKAYATDMVEQLPIKVKKLKTKVRFFQYFVIIKDNKTLLRKRTNKDIWQGLYEPPLIETNEALEQKKLAIQASLFFCKDLSASSLSKSSMQSQKLTHQTIHATFYNLGISFDHSDYAWYDMNALYDLAMPRIVDRYFKSYMNTGVQGSLF